MLQSLALEGEGGKNETSAEVLEFPLLDHIQNESSRTCGNIINTPRIRDVETLNLRLKSITSFLESGKPEIAEKLYYVFKKDLILGLVFGDITYDNSITLENPYGIQDEINDVYSRIFGKIFDATLDTFFAKYCCGVKIPSFLRQENIMHICEEDSKSFCEQVDKFFIKILN